jgi:SPP1 gp7 family putative phage head morphogenesis protein
MQSELSRIAKSVYAGDIADGDIDSRLLSMVGNLLEKQVTDGFGTSFANIDFTTPDAAMRSRLVQDVWQFASARNYQEMRDMALALVDADGNVRSFANFRDQASAINSTYNVTWLKTEHSFALNSATTAARWGEYLRNADAMPYLQYDTVGDSNVRPEHALLDGIIRKIGDDFWKTYYPPNGWRCRCDARQLASSYAQETQTIPQATVAPMFKQNLAEQGLAFPKGHVFYEGIPAGKLRDAINSLPDDVAYRNAYSNEMSGGNVHLHIMHGAKELRYNMPLAEWMADYGHKVALLPDFINAPDSVRKQFFGNKAFRSGKNPAAIIDDKIFDMKRHIGTDSAIKSGIRRGARQADNILIWLTNDMPFADIERAVKGQMNNSLGAQEVWIFTADHELLKYTRKGLGL